MMNDPDYENRVKRFAEYDKQVKEMRKSFIQQLPWYKRWMFITIGDVWDSIFKRKAQK